MPRCASSAPCPRRACRRGPDAATNRRYYQLQLEGSKTALELPGVLDEVVTLAILKAEDGSTYRGFVTRADNPYGYPSKDRSGRLDAVEEPHLGKLIQKCLGDVPQA